MYQFLVLDFLEVTNGMGKRIEDYKHINSGRLNNPDVGLVNSTNDSDSSKKRYLFEHTLISHLF